MIPISFVTGMIAVIVLWLIFRTAVCLRAGAIHWRTELLQLVFLINLMVIVRFTFYPFSKVDGQVQPLLFDPAAVFPLRINLVPFVNLLDYDSSTDMLLNIIGNFSMFIPTGILTPLIYRRIHTLKKTVLFGFALSLSIEILQLPFAVRASDVDDLILNTAGCLAGYGIYALIRHLRSRSQR